MSWRDNETTRICDFCAARVGGHPTDAPGWEWTRINVPYQLGVCYHRCVKCKKGTDKRWQDLISESEGAGELP